MEISFTNPIFIVSGVIIFIIFWIMVYHWYIFPLLARNRIFTKHEASSYMKTILKLFETPLEEFEFAYMNAKFEYLLFTKKGVIIETADPFKFFFPYQALYSFQFVGFDEVFSLKLRADLKSKGAKVVYFPGGRAPILSLKSHLGIQGQKEVERLVEKGDIKYSQHDKVIWALHRIGPKHLDEIHKSLRKLGIREINYS